MPQAAYSAAWCAMALAVRATMAYAADPRRLPERLTHAAGRRVGGLCMRQAAGGAVVDSARAVRRVSMASRDATVVANLSAA